MRNTIGKTILPAILLLATGAFFTLSGCKDEEKKEAPTEVIQMPAHAPDSLVIKQDSLPLVQDLDSDKTKQAPPPIR